MCPHTTYIQIRKLDDSMHIYSVVVEYIYSVVVEYIHSAVVDHAAICVS